jgi:HPt (histidine-containing phosphotransfer) domain-containing protein
MRRLGGDIELFREFVEIFREDSPLLLESIRQGARDRDGVTLSRGAHSLKGLTSNFGARGAVEVAKLLEEISERQRWQEAPEAVRQLEFEISRLHAELDQFCKREQESSG